jgi:ABC-type Na+ efflux pump permease subunit
VTAPTRRSPVDWNAVRAVIAKDMTAVRRSKAVVIPMLALPALMLIALPAAIAIAVRAHPDFDVNRFLGAVPGGLTDPILALPERERLIVLINGYMLAPMLLIVPLMVSAVLAADAFAGEKERKTLESMLHLPLSDRDLFLAKMLSAYLPAVGVTWAGFVSYTLVTDVFAWPMAHRAILPTPHWIVLMLWVAPGVAALGLGLMVRVSARARSSQEANQLGGAVILPLVFVAVGQATALLAIPLAATALVGLVIWVLALVLAVRGARRYTRDVLATKL